MHTSSLCWQNFTPAKVRRRNIFTTWTLAEWVGTTAGLALGYSPMQNSYLRDIQVHYHDEFSASLSEVVQYLRVVIQRQARSTVLHTHGQLEQYQGNSGPDFSAPLALSFSVCLADLSSFEFLNDYDWLLGRYFGARICLAPTAKTEMRLPFTPIYFLDHFRGGNLGCLLLATREVERSDNKYCEVHLLLIRWIRSGEAHRIGKVTAELDNSMALELEEHIKSLDLVNVKLY